MRMTLEEIIEDAVIHGYDFGELISRKENKFDYKEYIYGYSLSEDKLAYLEAMAKDEVDYCDRIKYFEKELNDCVKEMEKMPHSKIISGFYKTREFEDEHSEHRVSSPFRILLIDEKKKEVIAKDLDYMDYKTSEALFSYVANINYFEAIDEINTNGYDSLFKKAEKFTIGFFAEGPIYLN